MSDNVVVVQNLEEQAGGGSQIIDANSNAPIVINVPMNCIETLGNKPETEKELINKEELIDDTLEDVDIDGDTIESHHEVPGLF